MDQLASGVTRLDGVHDFLFHVWGRFAAIRLVDGADITPRGRKSRALLAFLLIEDRPVARDQLAGLLWSERGQAQAHGSLRQCLTELRDLAPTIRIERHQVTLDRPATDLGVMLAAAADGDAETLASNLARGSDLFEDLDGVDLAFDDWLRAVRTTRSGALVAAALACCRKAIATGAIEAAQTLARTLSAIDPLDEGIARLAMEAAHSAGKQDSVRRIHDRLATTLMAELGVAPSAETRALHDRLIADAPAPAKRSAPPSTESVPEVERGPASSPPRSRRHRWGRPWLLSAAALLALLVAGGALVMPRMFDRGGAEPASLAVLPFRNLSPGDDYFAEGVAEEILAQLAREPELRVAGRTSSALFKDRAADLRDVGRRLDVAYVLEGSVRQVGDRVRVDVALVGTRDGMRLWTHRFEGRLDDIFAIQNEIGAGVAASLRRRLVNIRPLTGPLTTTGEVYNLYLTARRLIRTRDPQNARTAIDLLRRAVRIDPNYAPAWSSLGEAMHFDWLSDSDQTAESRRHVRRALALAPDLAEAHAAMGLIEDSTPRGRAHLERAVRLDPNNAEAWLWLHGARAQAYDFEGSLAAARRVADIDPLWERANQVSDPLWSFGYRDEALRREQRLIASHPLESHREMARGRIAGRNGDWSGFVLHFLRAGDLNADVRFDAHWRANGVMAALGLPWDERILINRKIALYASLVRGRLPRLSEFIDRLGTAREYWDTVIIPPMASRAFLNQGRSTDLVALYDSAFDGPEEFLRQTTGSNDVFNVQAPLVAIALRQAGRRAEARKMLDLAARRLAPLCRRDRLPGDLWAECARLWAVRGHREEAISALGRAARMGWPLGYDPFPLLMPQPDLAADPAFRTLLGDPRFRQFDARIKAHFARERRELQAALPTRT